MFLQKKEQKGIETPANVRMSADIINHKKSAACNVINPQMAAAHYKRTRDFLQV